MHRETHLLRFGLGSVPAIKICRRFVGQRLIRSNTRASTARKPVV
jgi:hypothetical protein